MEYSFFYSNLCLANRITCRARTRHKICVFLILERLYHPGQVQPAGYVCLFSQTGELQNILSTMTVFSARKLAENVWYLSIR